MFDGVLGDPSKSEEERLSNIKRATKLKHADKNPCIKEHEMSFKCLDENNYNRDNCAGYFENYKRCREFWSNIRLERRQKGITPNLPPVGEREQIKKDHMEKIRAMRQAQQ